MLILRTVSEVKQVIASFKNSSKTVGFVPTMGALHAGHISLVKECSKQNDITIVSIFVNPTQFNNIEDLQKYPRTEQEDAKLLDEAGTDLLFMPTVDEIYPEPDQRTFSFGQLDQVMEGKFRPGHFNGVAQVVSRLFDIIEPDKAYFGEKDFQQLAIIRDMVRQYTMPVQIAAMPIKREVSGLAMSSRNQRLTDEQKQEASLIYTTLSEAKSRLASMSVKENIDFVVDTINKSDFLKVEYYEIVNGITLQPISDWDDATYVVGCIAVFCGDVRLIDNITYFNNETK